MMFSLLRILINALSRGVTKPQPRRDASDVGTKLNDLHRKMEETSKNAADDRGAARTWLLDHADATLPEQRDRDLISAVFPEDGFKGIVFAPDKDALKTDLERRRTFMILMDWRTEGDWENDISVDKKTRHLTAKTDDPTGKTKVAVETVLCHIMHKGFRPRPEHCVPILRFLTTSPPGFAGGIPERLLAGNDRVSSLGILTAWAVDYQPTGYGTDKEEEDLLDQLAHRFLNIGDPYLDWTTSARDCHVAPPDVAAMMTLTGRKRDSILQQAQRRPTARLGAFVPPVPVDLYLKSVKAVDDALDRLIAEFEDTGGHPDWMESPEAYMAVFGTCFDEQAAFGWWTRPRDPKNLGIKYDVEQYTLMQSPGYFDDRLSLSAAGKALLAEPVDVMPVTFFQTTVPAVEFFTFEGKDAEGKLLEHLATIKSHKPTKAWLTTAAQHIDIIGMETVATGLRDWLALMQPIASDIGGKVYGKLTREAPPAAVHLFHARSPHASSEPATGAADWANRTALKLMLLPFAFRKNGRGPGPATVQEAILEDEQSGEIPALTSSVLTGVLALAPTLQPHIAPETVERVADYCFRDAEMTHNQLRSRSAGNAAVHALGQYRTQEAIEALRRLRAKFPKDKAILKQIDAAMTST